MFVIMIVLCLGADYSYCGLMKTNMNFSTARECQRKLPLVVDSVRRDLMKTIGDRTPYRVEISCVDR